MNLIDRQRDLIVARSVDRTTILPIGQAVVVRIPTGNRTSTNPPAVVIRYYRSASSQLLPRRSDGWPRTRATSCASGALFRQGRAGFLNWFGPVARCVFGALVQPAKQSSRRFTYRLHSFVAPAFHEQKQTTGEVGSVQFQVGAVRSVEC